MKRMLSILLVGLLAASMSATAMAAEISDETLSAATVSDFSIADTTPDSAQTTLTQEVQITEKSADEFFGEEHSFNFDETKRALPRSVATSRFADNYYWVFGDTMYGLDDYKDIVKIDLATGEETVVYTDPDRMDRVYLEPEMAYIQKGNTIYRLHIPTQNVAEVFDDENLVDFLPLSNTSIRVTVTSPEYIEYLEETGNDENELGIPETVTYEVNANTGSKEEVILYPDESPVPMTRAVSTGSYGSGKYFTKNGSSCSSSNDSHGSNCSYTNPNANCNCKIYSGAIQCMGYAKYVYAQNSRTWGSSTKKTWTNSTAAQRTAAEAALKTWVEGKGEGAHMRIMNNGHSVIVTSTNSTGFNVIQANADYTNCKVTTGSQSYATIVKNYTYISTN